MKCLLLSILAILLIAGSANADLYIIEYSGQVWRDGDDDKAGLTIMGSIENVFPPLTKRAETELTIFISHFTNQGTTGPDIHGGFITMFSGGRLTIFENTLNDPDFASGSGGPADSLFPTPFLGDIVYLEGYFNGLFGWYSNPDQSPAAAIRILGDLDFTDGSHFDELPTACGWTLDARTASGSSSTGSDGWSITGEIYILINSADQNSWGSIKSMLR